MSNGRPVTLKDLLQIQFDVVSKALAQGFTGEFVVTINCRSGGIASANLHQKTNLRDLQAPEDREKV